MSQTYKAKVAEHILLSPNYHWFTLDLSHPTILDFQSGQFILLDVPGITAKKAYSIPSSPANKSQINLLIDVSPQGDGTRYLQSLKPGDECSFLAPAGQFVLSDNPEEESVSLIATGSGISAVRSMALWLLQSQHDTRPINLHWGMRHLEDTFWMEEFRMMEEEFENFHFDLVLSDPPEGWPLCKGHINDCLSTHYANYEKTGYYICGNIKMVEGIAAFLAAKNVNEKLIHHERFG